MTASNRLLRDETEPFYEGIRGETRCSVVHVDKRGASSELPLRLDVWNHSPTGFEWGYAGSGPAQLALAILCHFLHNVPLARRLYQQFKFDHVVHWRTSWRLNESELVDWMHKKGFERDNPLGAWLLTIDEDSTSTN